MRQKTKQAIRTAFNLIKAVAIVVSPHTFFAKLAEVLTAIDSNTKNK